MGKAITIESSVEKWMQWTNVNFPKSGTEASLIHLQEEIKELLEAINDPAKFEYNEGIALMEYADCFICLLTAAGKSGFTIEQLFKAIQNKMEINYNRKWVLNADNTYSHVKS